ncbi:hypothetical protein [Qipengyuania sp. ASV99]|uniref:hypothetical protein n=1 Tax=Qipengyuania sp. ASV99 TaxID=3399681 RepID=UPI003A4C8047
MRQQQEGPLERKFWKTVGVVTFGPIALALGLIILAAVFGVGRDSTDAIGLLLFFGLAMVGVLNFGFGLTNIVKGKSDQFNWTCLLLGGGFAAFFGSGVLQALGVEF